MSNKKKVSVPETLSQLKRLKKEDLSTLLKQSKIKHNENATNKELLDILEKIHFTKNVDIDDESNIFLEAPKNLTDLKATKVGDLMKYLDQHNLAYNPNDNKKKLILILEKFFFSDKEETQSSGYENDLIPASGSEERQMRRGK